MSIFDQAGYFVNDNRASGGKLDEDDLIGCAHVSPGCLSPTMKKAEWRKQGGFCFACGKPLCLRCYERTRRYGCEGPEVRRIEAAVADAYRREQNSKLL